MEGGRNERPERTLCAPNIDSSLKTSSALKLRRSLFEKCSRAFVLVFSSGAESEERRLERQAFGLTRLQPFINCFDRILNGDWCVGKDFPQECFRSRNKIGRRNDFVHQSDSIRLGRVDHGAGKY